MILVDKNIKELSAEGKLIKEAYTEENVNSISYDLTLGSFADKAETEKKIDTWCHGDNKNEGKIKYSR